MSVLASPALTAENAYDILDRVTNITYRAADRALVRAFSYAYDPLGRRISTTDGSGTAFHVYDGDECTADMDAAGTPLRSYTWGPGIDNLLAITVYAYQSNSLQPIASSYYAVKDHLGSVQALADISGAVVESYTYDAWGNVLAGGQQSAIGNRYLWQGREYSFASGLYNFRARWYDPQSGRWLSKDPIGLEGGLNLYVFCGDDPVNFVDPWGCDPFQDFADAVAEPLDNAVHNLRNVIGRLRNAILGEPESDPYAIPYITQGPPPAVSGDDIINAIPLLLGGIRGGGRSPFPPARRIYYPKKKPAYDAAKRAGKGAEPRHDPHDTPPHYHPDIPQSDNPTPHQANPHDHYYYPSSQR